MGDIFISHVEEDAAVAMKIAECLEEAGYSAWYYERDSLPGPSYLLQTAREIERSRAMVLIISPHSLGSHQITKEVIRAHESGKPFIPVLNGITHVEFANRQPEWREAVGSATSVSIPRIGVGAILPRILEGVRSLGIAPAGSDDAGARDDSYFPFTEPKRLRSGANLWPKIAVVAVLVVAMGTAGTITLIGGRDGKGQGLASQQTPSPTATPSETPTTIVSETPSITTPPMSKPPPSAMRTSILTSQGPLRVSQALLTTIVCPPPGIPGQCKQASGSNRYLQVSLRSSSGGDVGLSQTFTNEAYASAVSFEGRRAGATSIYLNEGLARIQIVYEILPARAAKGEVLIHWPDNPTLRLTITT